MNLDHNFFQESKLSEDPKKRKVFTKIGRLFSPNSSEDQKKTSSPKLEDFFSSNSSEDQRSDAGQSEIIKWDMSPSFPQVLAPLFTASFKA